MTKKFKGSLELLSATFIWGTAFIAQSVGMDYIGPFTFQVCRCALGALFLFPLTLLFDALRGEQAKSMAAWKDPKLWKAGFICGCALFVAAGLQQVGLVYTDAGKAGFITAMYIVMVPILGVFIGMRPKCNTVISVVIAVIGLYLLSCVGVTEINKGDIMLLGCALGFAVQILCVDKCAGDLDGLRLNCVQAMVASVFSIPFMLLMEAPTISSISFALIPILYAGIMSMGIAYSLQIIGQKEVEPTTASLLMSLESVFAALSGWIILKESMTAWELCGCALVFTAVIISQLPSKK